MSALDLFASALGAFILIAVILFPHYQRMKQIKQAKSATQQAIFAKDEEVGRKRQLEARRIQRENEIKKASSARAALETCRKEELQCRASQETTFLVIGIEWEKRCDVDLYVTDPFGTTFSYVMKSTNQQLPPLQADGDTNNLGQLSFDVTDGPGMEIWQNPRARAGVYRIEHKLAGLCSNVRDAEGAEAVLVKGWVIDRAGGLRELPTQSSDNQSKLMGSIAIELDGSSTLHRGP